MNIRSGRVGSDVSTDGVTVTGRTVRVEFTTVITGFDVELGEITETVVSVGKV